MDPLTPTTSTLTPAISHIAETAASLSSSLHRTAQQSNQHEAADKIKQKKTVQWVLNAPSRLRDLRFNGKEEEARTEWSRVSKLLDHWKGVQGVEQVQKECKEVMET